MGAVLLKGVTIGKHAVVGAGSIVNESVPDYALALGNPAKVVKSLRLSSHIENAPGEYRVPGAVYLRKLSRAFFCQ